MPLKNLAAVRNIGFTTAAIEAGFLTDSGTQNGLDYRE